LNVDAAAGVFDDHHRETLADRVLGGITDAKVQCQAGQEQPLDAALMQIADQSSRGDAVVLVKRGVGIDGAVDALAA
jgi:hypothetical protein